MKKLLFIVAACLLAHSSAVGVPALRDATLAINQVAAGFTAPTTMAFIGPDDILVLQKKDGRVRRVSGGASRLLGAASGLNTELLNADSDSVNFAVAEGSSFKIFAADFLGQMFAPGSLFTLSVAFADDGTVDQSIIIP